MEKKKALSIHFLDYKEKVKELNKVDKRIKKTLMKMCHKLHFWLHRSLVVSVLHYIELASCKKLSTFSKPDLSYQMINIKCLVWLKKEQSCWFEKIGKPLVSFETFLLDLVPAKQTLRKCHSFLECKEIH